MKNKKLLALLFSVLVVGGFLLAKQSETIQTFNPFSVFGNYETERSDGYYSILDDKGKVLDQTAMGVFVGDEFIAPDNKRYKIVKIQGDIAYSEYVGTEKIVWDPAWNDTLTASTESTKAVQGKANGGNRIAIYHTHSDESYVPTDGKESIYGNGGIYKVGKSLSGALSKAGIIADHSYNRHDPHDASAYHRSRRTAVQLLKKNPLALIDVHRDAVPPQVYKANIKGESVTKVKLVVGRQNPHMATTMAFAKKIKAYEDKINPGLIEGIFIAHGNYNQDLSPRAILIEVGSHTNSRLDAQRGVDLFSSAIPKIVGASATPGSLKNEAQPPSNAGNVKTEKNSGSWGAIGWILGIVLVGGAIFLLVSTGSIKGSVDKIKHFTGSEFANVLGGKEVDTIKEDKNLSDACPGGNCVEDQACPDGTCVEDTACPDGTCAEDTACPDGNCVDDQACPDGTCVEDTTCPGGNCVEDKTK